MLRRGEVDRGQDLVVRLCQIIIIIVVVAVEGAAQVDRDNININKRATCQGIEPHDPSQQLNIQYIAIGTTTRMVEKHQ